MKFDKKIFFYFILIPAFQAITGCDIINPEEPIPAQIHIEETKLVLEPGQGSSRHKLTEVWVYADGSYIGAFATPTTIPYITDSVTTTFTLRAGIRNNGILDDAIYYPMLLPLVYELPTTPGSESTVAANFSYKPEAVFSLISDFELGNDFTVDRDTSLETMLVRTSTDPFEGNYSGEIVLTKEKNLIEVTHSFTMIDLPTGSNPKKETYLEFRYKADMEFSVGLLGIPLNGEEYAEFFYIVKRSDEWNMIYLDLTSLLEASGLSAYKILFRSFYPPEATAAELKIQLDNIKVVHL